MGALYSLAAETADVGIDAFSTVTDDYDPWDNAFTGTINWIKVKQTWVDRRAGRSASIAGRTASTELRFTRTDRKSCEFASQRNLLLSLHAR